MSTKLNRSCPTCGVVVSDRNKSGYCKKHRVWKDSEQTKEKKRASSHRGKDNYQYTEAHHVLEERDCMCGCGNKFKCVMDSKQQYIYGHNRRGVEVILKTRLKLREQKLGDKSPSKCPEVAKKISIGRKGKNIGHPIYSSYRDFSRGFRNDLQCYFRSSWEANIARILNYEGLLWEYEPKYFVLIKDDSSKTSYRPDFNVEGVWWEIKGYMREENRKKLDLFCIQYPLEDFILVGKKQYKQLEIKYSGILPNWEYKYMKKKYKKCCSQ